MRLGNSVRRRSYRTITAVAGALPRLQEAVRSWRDICQAARSLGEMRYVLGLGRHEVLFDLPSLSSEDVVMITLSVGCFTTEPLPPHKRRIVIEPEQHNGQPGVVVPGTAARLALEQEDPMKRLFVLIAMFVALLANTPAANAQCSGALCPFGGCPWYNHIGNSTFESSCAWDFAGAAGYTVTNMCGWTGNNVGQMTRNQYQSVGRISQAFNTSNDYLDVYSLSYFIETTNMQSGDHVDVYIIDFTSWPYTWHFVESVTTNLSCERRDFSYPNPGWKGHSLAVWFESSFGSSSTSAYIDNAAFWQKTN